MSAAFTVLTTAIISSEVKTINMWATHLYRSWTVSSSQYCNSSVSFENRSVLFFHFPLLKSRVVSLHSIIFIPGSAYHGQKSFKMLRLDGSYCPTAEKVLSPTRWLGSGSHIWTQCWAGDKPTPRADLRSALWRVFPSDAAHFELSLVEMCSRRAW